MTTNILATLLTLFSTNAVTHWPQKQVPNPPHQPSLGEVLLTDGSWTDWGYHMEPDTNADTRSIETTVTRQRLLCFEIELQHIETTVTNETVAHYQVDEQRVRTNQWFQTDDAWYLTAFTNKDLVSRWRGGQNDSNGKSAVLLETNWFEPVATNDLPLAAWRDFWLSSMTNSTYITNRIGISSMLWYNSNSTN